MRSLIVDDDLVCRRLLALALGRHGAVTQAATGAEAVQAVARALRQQARNQLIRDTGRAKATNHHRGPIGGVGQGFSDRGNKLVDHV